MNDLYTFYFQYRGGSYTSQFRGPTVKDALKEWAAKELPTVYEVKSRHIKDVTEEIDRDAPTAVGPDRIKNVWYMGFLSGNTHMHLMIVKTDGN